MLISTLFTFPFGSAFHIEGASEIPASIAPLRRVDRSIDRSCSPFTALPHLRTPYLKQVLLLCFPQFCTDLQNLTSYTNLTEKKTEFPERASSSISDLCIDICSFFFFPVFDSSPFASPFCFAEVPMRASNLVLLSSSLFPY